MSSRGLSMNKISKNRERKRQRERDSELDREGERDSGYIYIERENITT